jgi:hypothetical protein
MSTLFQVRSTILDYAKQQDSNESTLAERVALAVNALRDYVPADALNPRESAEFKNAAESVKFELRAVYLDAPRFKGRDRSEPVNMVMVRAVANMPEAEREKLAKDSAEKKAWEAMLAYCRNIWRDIADEAYPKPKTDKPQAEEKHASADQVLATVKSFLAGNPDPVLAKNVFDQIALLRPTK